MHPEFKLPPGLETLPRLEPSALGEVPQVLPEDSVSSCGSAATSGLTTLMELRSKSAQLQSKLTQRAKYNSGTIISRTTPGRVAQRTSQHSSDLCQIGSASSGGSGVRVRGTEAGPVSVGSSIATSDLQILRRASRARAAAAQAVASAPITGYDQLPAGHS